MGSDVSVFDPVSTDPCDAALATEVRAIRATVSGYTDPITRYVALAALVAEAVEHLIERNVCAEERIAAIQRLVRNLRPTVLYALVCTDGGVHAQPMVAFEGPDHGVMAVLGDVPVSVGEWVGGQVQSALQLRRDIDAFQRQFHIGMALDAVRAPTLGPDGISLFVGVLPNLSRNFHGYLVLQHRTNKGVGAHSDEPAPKRRAVVHCLVFVDNGSGDPDAPSMSSVVGQIDLAFLRKTLPMVFRSFQRFWSNETFSTRRVEPTAPVALAILRPRGAPTRGPPCLQSSVWYLDDSETIPIRG